MPTDKHGNKLTWKEYRERFKDGVEAITPMQQTKTSLIGAILVVAGVIFGLIITFSTGTWWLFSILLGSLLMTGVTLLGLIQKYIALAKIDKAMEGLKQNE